MLLRFIRSLEPITDISLKQLTYKLICLCALTTGQRAQTLSLFDVRNMTVVNKQVTILITELIKTSKLGKARPVIILSAYPHDKTICVVRTLLEYLRRTKTFRNSQTKLFLSYAAPHKEIGAQTVSRWLKLCLTEAGIDVMFKSHSFRAASTSAAARKGVPIDFILQTAGWTNSSTFAKFYNRSSSIISPKGPQTIFANSVLSS